MRAVPHTADDEVLEDVEEEHLALCLHDHLEVLTVSPFGLKATDVRDQYH